MIAQSPNVRLTIEILESRALPSTVADLPVVPDIDYSMSQNLQAIYQRGQAMGNHANVFMKVGDSLTAEPDSISAMSPTRFDIVSSGLATGYPELVDTWQTYASPKVGGDSFGRNSFAARSRTYVSQALMNLPAEIATIRPSIALIHVGTNDFAYGPESFRQQLLAIVSHTIDSGVIPIVTLLPTAFNFEMGGSYNGFVDQFNSVVIQVAEQFNIPVWNLHKALEPLPLYGLRDGVHLTAIGGGALFTAGALNFGYNMRNLSALQVLDKVRDMLANPITPSQPDAPWQSLQAGRQYTATTTDDPFRVVVTDRDNNNILSFNSFYNGQAAIGDFNGDSIPDVALASGRGESPTVKIRDGRDGSVIRESTVFDPSFKGGVNLAVGNFNGDKVTDIAVGAGMGGGPLVHILNGLNFSDMGSFFAYEPSFRGGVNIATADVDGDGIDEIITGAGNGGSPLVKVFSARGDDLDAFFAYESGLRTGVRVAGEDIDGDGREELITAPLMGIQRIQAFAVGNRDPKLNYFATADEELPFSVRVG